MSFFARLTALLALATLVIVFLVLPLQLACAQTGPTEYEPLAPIKGISDPGVKVTAATYIPGLFRLGIGIASALAVLAIAFGGIKYMTSDVVTSKSDAIQMIKNALLGLLLAISAFLLLETIDPQLTGQSALGRLTNLQGTPLPPPTVGVDRFILVYSTQMFHFPYATYEFELTFDLTPAEAAARGINPTVKVRYSTRATCDAQKTVLEGQGYTPSSCDRVITYTNYTDGTLITSVNSSSFINRPPAEWKVLNTLQECVSTRASFVDNPDRFTVPADCLATWSELQTVKKPTLAECQAVVSSLPVSITNINTNCAPI